MTDPDDPIVDALRKLTTKVGGHVPLADAIGANDQTIYQILKGIRHPKSGNRKGVGPSLRARITAKFPDWLDTLQTEPSDPERYLLDLYRSLPPPERGRLLAIVNAAFPGGPQLPS